MLTGLLIAVGCCLLGPTSGADAAINPWLSMRVLNQAHQGGEDEVPSNTMYAYAHGLAAGSDMLELDVHSTRDHHIVVIHDDTVDRTTDGHGNVRDFTLSRLRALDAAYDFVPERNSVSGLPASSYPFRGVRTGGKPVPAGYDRDDFRIPTLEEVLRAYPHIPINVEIKGATQAEKFQVADDLAKLLNRYPRQDIIVVSFDQEAIDRFHAQAPRTPLAAGTSAVIEFLLLGQPLPPGTDAIQIPYEFSTDSIGIHLGVPLSIPLAESWVTQRAHGAGIAVHYWEVPENESAYRQVLNVCGDGVMTTRPTRFNAFLAKAGAPRVGGQGGSDHCGNAPSSPPPGCRLGVAKLVSPTGGGIAVRLERWGDLRAPCSARLTLRSAGRFAQSPRDRRRVRVGLGSARFEVPAGVSGGTAQLRLKPAARRLIARHPGLRVRAQLSGTASDGTSAAALSAG